MSQPDMFPHRDTAEVEPTTPNSKGKMVSTQRARIQKSALWAAYGDALGWISELTDSAGLSRRTGGRPLTEPMAWKRRIGGRSGVMASLPQGCYSDDTQLRLATSRAIRSDGFDVEAFSKVELPVWLSYGLGGGKSTGAAASYLSRSSSTWWRNRFKGWTHSGGNGAAMRIQPHVWAARAPEQPDSYLLEVVRNAICTHSHPTGLMGAVFHAQCVAKAMVSGNAPSPDDLKEVVVVAEKLPALLERDRELSLWRIAFEEEAGDFRDAWSSVVEETKCAIEFVSECGADKLGEERYRLMVDGLNLRDPARRGSGMLTAVAAAALAWCEPQAGAAMRIATNELGTDTDTIATMSGAIIGATLEMDPPVEVLDADLIRRDAARLADIASDRDPANHPYPDLLHWPVPRTRSDALARAKDGGLIVLGLGRATKLKDEPELASHGFRWRWVRLEFGQTLLVKGRADLQTIDDERLPVSESGCEIPRTPVEESRSGRPSQDHRETIGTISGEQREHGESPEPGTHDIQAVVAYVHEHIHDDKAIGRALRRVVRKGTTGEVAGFTAAVVDLLREDVREENS